MIYIAIKKASLSYKIKSWLQKRLVLLEAPATKILSGNIKNFIIKFAGSGQYDGKSFFESEHDLNELKLALNTDSYLKIACIKYYQLIIKSGFQLTSENEKALEYVKQRLKIMEFSTNTPFDVLLSGIAEDLVAYSNAFLVKSRIKKIPMNIQAKGVWDKQPIGGYFRMDPTTITVRMNKDGSVAEYKQTSGDKEIKFKATDVIHFYIDKEAENIFGTPRFYSALEDVKILRKVEGNTLNLLYRFAIPLYHAKVGLPKENFMATETEIDDVRKDLNNMPMDGVIVSGERLEFKEIGANGTAIDMVPYLNYYEKRVFSALNLSESTMGRGGAKQDADSMEQQTHDQVKFFQHTIRSFIEKLLFTELLLEGGFNPIADSKDQVNFVFNEISLDTKIKMENHTLTKYQGNLITFDEARRELGLISDNIDTSELYSNMITQKNALELLSAKGDAVSGKLFNGKEKDTSKVSKTAISKNQPSNQHGTYSAKVKESINVSESTEENIQKYRKEYSIVDKKYRSLCNSLSEVTKEKLDKKFNAIKKDIFKIAQDKTGYGSLAFYLQANKKPNVEKINIDVMESMIQDTTDKLCNDIWKRLKENEDLKNRRHVLQVMEYRLRFACEYFSAKAFWYGFAKTAYLEGIHEIFINFHSKEDADEHRHKILTKSVTVENIPPFKPYCKCTIGISR